MNKLLALSMLTCCLQAYAAEDMNDPTRPAFDLLPGLDDGRAEQQAPVARGLQSVILSSGHDAAIIDGKKIEVGQSYDGAVLTVVNETCVVLNGPGGRRVMHMYPAVNMSSTELACEGQRGLPNIGQTHVKRKIKKKTPKKKVVTCVNGDTSDGSGK